MNEVGNLLSLNQVIAHEGWKQVRGCGSVDNEGQNQALNPGNESDVYKAKYLFLKYYFLKHNLICILNSRGMCICRNIGKHQNPTNPTLASHIPLRLVLRKMGWRYSIAVGSRPWTCQ